MGCREREEVAQWPFNPHLAYFLLCVMLGRFAIPSASHHSNINKYEQIHTHARTCTLKFELLYALMMTCKKGDFKMSSMEHTNRDIIL